MKKTLTIIGRALLCGLLLCATILLFCVAVVTIEDQPIVWLMSCMGAVAAFVTAVAVSLGAFESAPKAAPRAATRTSSGNASDTVAA